MGAGSFRLPLFQLFNVATASPNYMYGRFSQSFAARKPAKTTGSSTDLDAVTAGDGPFDEVGVGDEVHVNRDGTHDVRYITAVTDGDNAAVNSAVDWEVGPQGSSGRHFHIRKFQSGTGAEDGWFSVRHVEALKIQLIVTTINATSITFRAEGRIKGPQTTATLIDEETFTAAGSGYIDVTRMLDANWDEVRLGVQVAGDSGLQSVTAYALGVAAAA
jgi:hypothetical protein